MVKKQKNAFLLGNEFVSYVVRINPVGKPVLDYFGAPLPEEVDLASLSFDPALVPGRSVSYSSSHPEICLSSLPLEAASRGKGDFLSPSLKLENAETSLFDFVFESAETVAPLEMEGYPTPRLASDELILRLIDKPTGVKAELHYLVYPSGVLGRYLVLENSSKGDLIVRKASSLCLSIEDKGYELHSFRGGWIDEFHEEISPLSSAQIRLESSSGSSNDLHNPFFFLSRKGSSYSSGDCYGFNLVYSGNHQEEIEKSPFGHLRILQGLSEEDFAWKLSPGERFVTPLAVFAYSQKGRNGMASLFHRFVRESVLPEAHKDDLRPIVYNNWEGTYFSFNESKLHRLAKKAKELGAELFVLDDGWFGKRDDDRTSLGDWFVNEKKLPHGIKGLGEYLHKNGLLFGLWFEPEAISPDSDLYRAHPDWALSHPSKEPSLGRNELLLDLCKEEVRDYLFERISHFIDEGKIDFIKWDYNRVFSDLGKDTGAHAHRYILSLYSLLRRLREKYPSLWMENCASGGGRNDLGMFSYFDTGWVSDDTDSFERSKIQSAMALGYPLCLMSNHVSAKTNHQTLRKTSFGTKFDVACFGVLGYELNLNDLDPIEEKEIKAEIEFYKKNRRCLQFGEYRLLERHDDRHLLIQEVFDGEKALASCVRSLQAPNPGYRKLRLEGLETGSLYAYSVRPEEISFLRFGGLVNTIAPIHIKEEGFLVNEISRRKGMGNEKFSGTVASEVLLGDGLPLKQEWSGTGLNDEVAVVLDFGARIYLFEKKIDKGESTE